MGTLIQDSDGTYPRLIEFPLKEQSYSLGVLKDPGLLLDKQVAAAVKSAFYCLCLVSQLWAFQNRKDLPTLVKARITFILYISVP